MPSDILKAMDRYGSQDKKSNRNTTASITSSTSTLITTTSTTTNNNGVQATNTAATHGSNESIGSLKTVLIVNK